MNIIQAHGTESKIVVPFMSHTKDPNSGKVLKDAGEIIFNEILLNQGEWYFAAVECMEFNLKFHNYYPVKSNPLIKMGTSQLSYYGAKVFIEQVVKSICANLLSAYPQSSLFKPDGTLEREPSEDAMVRAFELFAQARPSDQQIDRTPGLTPKVKRKPTTPAKKASNE